VAGAQAIQIIVTVLLVATSAAVFVVAIGVFVALTLHKFGRLSGSPDHTSQSARESARRKILKFLSHCVRPETWVTHLE
jgi:hypothetical protein